MKTYKGKIAIQCTKKSGCLRNLHKDVAPGCIDCPMALTQIVDIEGKVLIEYKSPVEKTAKRKRG